MGFTDLNKPSKTLGANDVNIKSPNSTFGEILTTTLEPLAQGDFIHNINGQIFTTSTFSGGSITTVSGNAELSSGTSASGSSTVQLRRRLEYRPGQGSLMRATAIFDTPDAGNAQFVGAGTSECGYFIGYFAGFFGILHSETGAREVRKYTVSAGEGTESVTVTLDGSSVVVPVSGGADTSQTAYQLSLGDYSQVGKGGWLADAQGSSVFFIAARANATSTGAYSITSGGSIDGSFTREQIGEAQTNTFITSGSFNVDKLDGTGPSGFTINPQKGNVYQIGYQYLGYGNAIFGVENPETGKNTPCHVLKNPNTRTTPVLKDPNLSVLATSANIGGTTSKVIKTASMAAFTEGKVMKLDPKFSKSFSFSSFSEQTYSPLAIFKSNRFFDGRSSFGEFDIMRINGSNESTTKTLTVGFFLNAEINGDVDFQYVNEQESIVSVASLDPDSDTIVDLASQQPFHEFVIGPLTGLSENLEDLKFVFGPGSNFVIAIKVSSGNITGQVGVNWFEQQ